MGEGGIKNSQNKFRRLLWTAPMHYMTIQWSMDNRMLICRTYVDFSLKLTFKSYLCSLAKVNKKLLHLFLYQMFYLENSLIDKNYIFCTWIGELNTWYVLFSNNPILLLKQNYKGPCTILWTPRESHIRKSLKPQRASREVPCSPLFASQWAGSRASSGHLTSSLLAFNWRSQLLMVLDSVVKPSIYLKWKKGLRLRYRWKISTFY